MILLGIVTLINLGILILMVAQVRDLTTEVHHVKKDINALSEREKTHRDELEVAVLHVYNRMKEDKTILGDLMNKYVVLKRDVAVLSKKSVFGYEQNLDAFKEADENAGGI